MVRVEKFRQPSKHMFNHHIRNVTEKVQQRINALKIGQKMQDLPEELWHESFKYYVKEDQTRTGGPNLRIIRLDPNKPALTVTGYIFNKFVHPFEDRFISVREAAKLQDFPDDFEFKGSITSTQKQVGNAVPILLARAIFNQICQESTLGKQDLTALSLFCGAGGLDLGAHDANFQAVKIKTMLAIDIWPDACASLQGYYKNSLKVVNKDITEIQDPNFFWQKHTQTATPPDLIYGGPPCQSFSQAGKHKGLDDPRGSLLFHFIRFIEKLKPKYFMFENVANIISLNNGSLLELFLTRFHHLGYNVNYDVLCAADYGTPQLRKRAIFLGTDQHYPAINLPKQTHAKEQNLLGLQPYQTVGDALRNLKIHA